MRVVLTDGAVYHVRWEHVDLEDLRRSELPSPAASEALVRVRLAPFSDRRYAKVRVVTIAHAEYREEGGSLGLQCRSLTGESCCGGHDQFRKSEGRKISLTRAIAGLSKSDRTAFWKALLAETRVH